jgi:hypothetical protein
MKNGKIPKIISVEKSVKKLTNPIAYTFLIPLGLLWSEFSAMQITFFYTEIKEILLFHKKTEANFSREIFLI